MIEECLIFKDWVEKVHKNDEIYLKVSYRTPHHTSRPTRFLMKRRNAQIS
jgi:hypothetical protein